MPDEPRPEQPEPQSDQTTEADAQSQDDHEAGTPAAGLSPDDAGAQSAPTSTRDAGRRRILRPVEALDRLDTQWADRRPIEGRDDLTGLVLAAPEHPLAFDYLGAMGVTSREVANACQGWLDAQLAADTLELGRAVRPTVALVPAGRLWFVVRIVLDAIVIIDGPGYPSPVAAVIAARRRYRALLLAEAERDRASSAPTEEATTTNEAAGDGDVAGRDEDAPQPAGAE